MNINALNKIKNGDGVLNTDQMNGLIKALENAHQDVSTRPANATTLLTKLKTGLATGTVTVNKSEMEGTNLSAAVADDVPPQQPILPPQPVAPKKPTFPSKDSVGTKLESLVKPLQNILKTNFTNDVTDDTFLPDLEERTVKALVDPQDMGVGNCTDVATTAANADPIDLCNMVKNTLSPHVTSFKEVFSGLTNPDIDLKVLDAEILCNKGNLPSGNDLATNDKKRKDMSKILAKWKKATEYAYYIGNILHNKLRKKTKLKKFDTTGLKNLKDCIKSRIANVMSQYPEVTPLIGVLPAVPVDETRNVQAFLDLFKSSATNINMSDWVDLLKNRHKIPSTDIGGEQRFILPLMKDPTDPHKKNDLTYAQMAEAIKNALAAADKLNASLPRAPSSELNELLGFHAQNKKMLEFLQRYYLSTDKVRKIQINTQEKITIIKNKIKDVLNASELNGLKGIERAKKLDELMKSYKAEIEALKKEHLTLKEDNCGISTAPTTYYTDAGIKDAIIAHREGTRLGSLRNIDVSPKEAIDNLTAACTSLSKEFDTEVGKLEVFFKGAKNELNTGYAGRKDGMLDAGQIVVGGKDRLIQSIESVQMDIATIPHDKTVGDMVMKNLKETYHDFSSDTCENPINSDVNRLTRMADLIQEISANLTKEKGTVAKRKSSEIAKAECEAIADSGMADSCTNIKLEPGIMLGRGVKGDFQTCLVDTYAKWTQDGTNNPEELFSISRQQCIIQTDPKTGELVVDDISKNHSMEITNIIPIVITGIRPVVKDPITVQGTKFDRFKIKPVPKTTKQPYSFDLKFSAHLGLKCTVNP
ncbi:MAG: hypothetical protein HQK51_04180 [Oligoflexia bacterium]|nr:hypothetical protein [Oligoflexia bacterium]